MIRCRAAAILGRTQNERAAGYLLGSLGDPDGAVRASVANALGFLRAPAAVDPLIHTLADPDGAVRVSAANALGLLRAPTAVDPLILALTDTDAEVRSAAAHSLSLIGDERAREPFAQALHDPDPNVSRIALSGLVKLRDKRAVDLLIPRLGHCDPLTRRETAQALEQLGHKKWSKWVTGSSATGEEDFDRLAKSGHPQAIEPLIYALQFADWRFLMPAAKALEHLGDARAIEPLVHAISEHDTQSADVRSSLLSALHSLGGDTCVALAPLLRSSNVEVRRNAVFSLGQYGDARAVKPLIAALSNGDDKMRQDAATSLGRLATGQSAKTTIRALREQAVEPLIRALHDSDDGVRADSALALGSIGDKRAVEPLFEVLHDGYKRARYAATHALNQLGISPEKVERAAASAAPRKQAAQAHAPNDIPLALIRNMRVVALGTYRTSPRTCSICDGEALVVVTIDDGVPSGDLALTPETSDIPSALAGYCSNCQQVLHMKCARALYAPGRSRP